ncbi:hypothetical protein T484DRAFT_1749941 [Baffinella frigidus]|nr:hypothetical protein T484DRAFT_1749941 [Cryptophyta sp. CCMP2293]
MVAGAAGGGGGGGGGKSDGKGKVDRRKGVNWLADWKRKKDDKKKKGKKKGGGGGEEGAEKEEKEEGGKSGLQKKAMALVKGLRKAAKKARTFEVRKLVRKMMEAKEPGGDPSKVPDLQALQQVAFPL